MQHKPLTHMTKDEMRTELEFIRRHSINAQVATRAIDLVNSYWRFDDYQQPAASWHEKQALLKELSSLLLRGE